ncbi:hypothetical protein BCR33DRAFT_767671, partial [Rhizoclosmatium globosum]
MPSYKRIYVGKLPRDVTDRELRRDARDAVEKLDGSRFLGERIQVEPSKVQREDRNRDRDGERKTARGSGKNRLKVENLPSRISWQTLKDLMRKAGEVSFTDIDRDGNGNVEFHNVNDMEEAIKMFDDYEYEGKRLIVKENPGDRSSRRDDDDRDRRGSSRRDDRDDDDDRRSSRRRDDRD